MIKQMNLLPEENKIAYKKYYLKRLLVVFCALIFFIAVSGVIVSAPALFLLSSQKRELLSEIEFYSKKDHVLDNDLVIAEIKKMNDKAKLTEDTLKKNIAPSLIFKNIITKKNNGIKITIFSYEKGVGDRNAKNEDKISLSGIAKKRDDLILFEKQLKKEFGESEVVSPVSNLINGSNLDFSLFLYVKNEK